MNTELLGYVISGVVSLLVCLISNHYQRKQTEALILYRIDRLEEGVQKHNRLIERMYSVEQKVALHEERLEQLEKKGA